MTWGMVPYRLTYRPDLLGFVTILTSMFMHGGLLHIAGNLWFLRIFGDNVEDNMGPVRFAVFYLLCGTVAAIAQVAINPSSTIPMVGASGAIAGVLAAYLVLYPRARVLTLIPIFVFIQWAEIPAFVFIAVWFIYQFFAGVGSLSHGGGGVAFWAHIGGFIAGLVLVFLFRRPTEPQPRIVVRRAPGSTPWRDDPRW
jgi:membrane associated rhomboid family serine protease